MCLLSQPLSQAFIPLTPLGPSVLPPTPPPVRLHWTITALWGVDTFGCSSICGVVINFLSVIGLSCNILRFEAACSPAINHETMSRHFSCIILKYWAAAVIQRDRIQWPISIKKTWGSFVCYRLFNWLCSRVLSQMGQLNAQHMQPMKTTDSPAR